MYGIPPRVHLQGQTYAIIQAHVFSHEKGTHIHVFLYNIYRIYIYMSYYILFEGVCLVLSYPTHIWNAYVAELFLKIINAKNEACL